MIKNIAGQTHELFLPRAFTFKKS